MCDIDSPRQHYPFSDKIMGLIDELKAVVKLAQDVKNIPLYEKLMDLMTRVYGLHDENRTQQEEIRELRERLELRDSLRFESNFYWLEKNGQRDGPYCHNCYDDDHAVRRMQQMRKDVFGCPVCGLMLHATGEPVTDTHTRNRLGVTLPGFVKQVRGRSR